jgi:PhnB protein
LVCTERCPFGQPTVSYEAKVGLIWLEEHDYACKTDSSWIPYRHAVLVVNDAARAIDFYQRAFSAKEVMRMDTPQGKIGHAELKIGDSVVMLADEMPGMNTRSPQSLGGTTGGVFLSVENVDAMFQQAISAGAKVDAAPADTFWGDRYGRLTDPLGHVWSLATHNRTSLPRKWEGA